MQIDRCVCCERPFAELHAEARRHGIVDVETLQRHMAFGTGCGLCVPYVKRMLRTGEVVFHEIVTDEEEASRHESGRTESGTESGTVSEAESGTES